MKKLTSEQLQAAYRNGVLDERARVLQLLARADGCSPGTVAVLNWLRARIKP